MSLSPGTRLGSYDVIALIGSGGMGEVYRARDTKLDRDSQPSRRPTMSTHRRSILLMTFIMLLCVQPGAAQDDGWRTIEIETTDVTAPDVAITPDGDWLIFTLLGHLFRLPVDGGEADQLTFGPYYDTRPAVSPDGTPVAFQSDRDGSEGNIFLLELATGEITQLTHEPWADAPSCGHRTGSQWSGCLANGRRR